MTRVRLALLLLSLATVIAAFVYLRRALPDAAPTVPPTTQQTSAYADPAACASCHSEIARTYSLTGMGRSFANVSPGDPAFASGTKMHHQASDRFYTMLERDGRLFQRRHQIGFDGRETNVLEIEAHYVAGSGNHARTFIHRKADGTLVQLPLTWYAAPSASFKAGPSTTLGAGGYWAMSPGYDRPAHLDTRRPIGADCFSCHNGYPRAPVTDATSVPKFQEPLPEGIDCQRCHGPGQDHIAAVHSGDLDAARRAIVNPRTLDRTRQLETCMQCHLETTSSPLPFQIRRYEHAPFTYTPGTPLGEHFIHFDHAPGSGRDDKFEIASSAYRLRKSACFQRSEMTCVTCHDPHDIPRGEQAVQHYTAVCQTCHTGVHRAGTPQVAGVGPRATCVDCHMPKRRTEDAVHVVMTDHFIQRRRPPADLLAPRRESENFDHGAYRGDVALYYPPTLDSTPDNELYLALAQVQHGSNLDRGIPRLEAALTRHTPSRPDWYFELGRAYGKASNHQAAIKWYEEALRRDRNFGPALKELATAAMQLGQFPRAAEALERSVALQQKDADALADLGNVYLQQHRVADAQRVLEQSLALDSDLPRANNTMALVLVETGNFERAEEFARSAIRVQPDLAEARNNLGNMLARRRAFAEAAYHFEQAIRSNPDYAEAQHSYGVVLALVGDYAKAESALRAAIRLAPSRATPHTDLANVLAALRRTDAAAAEYERAIALDPTEADAHLALGEIRARQRRVEDARRHLEAAARSADPEIRSAALNALRFLDQ